MSERPLPSEPDGRVIDANAWRMRHPRKPTSSQAGSSQAGEGEVPSPVADIERYQRDEENDDDYRHRMFTNTAAAICLLLLIIAGVWIADTMATMRKAQDCVFSGRRNCAPIETPQPRW